MIRSYSHPLSSRWWSLLALVLALVVVPAFAAQADGGRLDAAQTDSYLVLFEDEAIAKAEIERIVAEAGGVVEDSMAEIGAARVRLTRTSQIELLEQHPAVQGLAADIVVDAEFPGLEVKTGNAVYPVDEKLHARKSTGALEGVSAAAKGGLESQTGTTRTLVTDPTQAPLFPLQWNMRIMDADDAWAAGHLGDPEVLVSVLGAGLDYTHEELAGVIDLDKSRSFVPADDALLQDLFPGAHPIAELGFHTTFVASQLACTGFAMGCVSPNVTLMGVKVLDVNETGTMSAITRGILYSIGRRADIILIPFNFTFDSTDRANAIRINIMRRVVNLARAFGVALFADSGEDPFQPGINLDADGTDLVIPAQAGFTAVGSSGPDDEWSGISNYGYTVMDLSAPGGIPPTGTRTQPEEIPIGACSKFTQLPSLDFCAERARYILIVGGKGASGMAAGVAALVDSMAGGHYSGPHIEEHLMRTADDLEGPGYDPFTGHGRVNALTAVTKPLRNF